MDGDYDDRETSTATHGDIVRLPHHLRSDARFGSRRRVNHPGEWVVGVMTAHPAWPQSEYDQNRAGMSDRWRGAAAEAFTRRRYEEI